MRLPLGKKMGGFKLTCLSDTFITNIVVGLSPLAHGFARPVEQQQGSALGSLVPNAKWRSLCIRMK